MSASSSASSTTASRLRAKHSGVYRAPRGVIGLTRQAQAVSLAWLDLKLARVGDKQAFLAACAKQLKFPKGFGDNWDALADCLRDFEWRGSAGYVLHVQGAEKFAAAAPDDYATALEILRLAADYWKEQRKPFIVLVDGAADLPAF
jgi:Barstar (barnase inhibitor)